MINKDRVSSCTELWWHFFFKKKKENSAFDVGHAVQVVTFFSLIYNPT